MVWTPMEFLNIRIDRDEEFITEVLNKCDLFWFDIVSLELLTRKRENENINDTRKIYLWIQQEMTVYQVVRSLKHVKW